LTVCGKAGNAEQALTAIATLQPDLVLVDISLPGKSGMEIIKEIRAVNRKVKLLVVSMHDEALYADRVLRAGGDGYIMKQEDPEEIIHAIRDVLGGHIYLSEQVLAGQSGGTQKQKTKARIRPLDELTDSELEILQLLGQGRNNSEIARQLHLPATKISIHIAQIKRVLNLKTTHELIRYAVSWVETGSA
jgi:DNA-binding NarL/FixJ family response regulator